MAEETSGRARWLGVVLLLLLVGVLAWQALDIWTQESPPPAATAVPTAEITSLRRPSIGDMLGEAESSRSGARLAEASVRAVPPPVPASAASAPSDTEVCGLGRVKDGADDGARVDAHMQAAALRARERVLPVLEALPDEVSRAAALMMQLGTPAPNAAASSSTGTGGVRDTLARMAVATGSSQVYGWALQACQNHRTVGACQMLSADRLAMLEPDNAAVWMVVASDAQARRDTAAVAEAMYRASLASRSDPRWGSLVATVNMAAPNELSTVEKAALAVQVMNIESQRVLPQSLVTQYCSVADVRDANRRQTCSAIAEVMAGRGTTLVDQAVGATVGERAGWPAERVAALRDERDAMSYLSQQANNDADRAAGPFSCSALGRMLNQFTSFGRLGEIGTLRAALKSSPEGAPVLARKLRAQRAADSASGAAASASASRSS